MATIYLCEQGALVRRSSRRIIVEKNKQTITDLPVIKIKHLFIFGNIQVTTQALNLLLENGIDVSFLTTRGRLRGKLNSSMSKNIFLRLAQYERWKDPGYKLELCRAIVEAKLRNMEFVIKRYLSNYPGESFGQFLDTINHGLVDLQNKQDIKGLLGIEGFASGAYFKAYGQMFRKELQFDKRVRRPPKDPVNALLSLGYTMITNEMASNLEGLAFDPFLGFLHGVKYGRKALALDMVEEFRQPLIDTFTLKLANLKLFGEEDFQEVPGEGVHLKDEKFKEYLELYEGKLRENVSADYSKMSWRELLQHQGKQLEKAILEGAGYLPYTMRKGGFG